MLNVHYYIQRTETTILCLDWNWLVSVKYHYVAHSLAESNLSRWSPKTIFGFLRFVVLVFALWKTNAARIHPQSVCVVIGLVSYTFTVVQSAQRVQGCHQIENDNAARITGWLFTISASDHVICGAAFGLRYRKMLDKLAHAHTNT